MTAHQEEPDEVTPAAASAGWLWDSLEQRERQADERDRLADQREAIADERDQLADERDQLADERDRIADVREWQISQPRGVRPDEEQRRRRQAIKQARGANDRDTARLDRLEAELAREDAERQRGEAELAYDTARHEFGLHID